MPHQERNMFMARVRINIYQNSSVTTEQENYLKTTTTIKKPGVVNPIGWTDLFLH